jgi:hypothetical protein
MACVSYASREKREPLREGYAIKPASTTRVDEEPPKNKGVDSVGVKRKLAPEVKPYRRGNLKEAALAVSRHRLAASQAALREDVYAKTTVGPRQSRMVAIKHILEAGGFHGEELAEGALWTLAAGLKQGHYRTAKAYLLLAKQMHVRAKHPWSDVLQDVLQQCVRSVERGLGPSRSAADFRLEDVGAFSCRDEPVVSGGPIAPRDAVVVASLWMMRGLEAASVLAEQVQLDSEKLCATIELGPTKMNPTGRDCPRSLVCGCASAGSAMCPYHSLQRLLQARERFGLTGKHPLLVTASGRAVTSSAMIQTLRKITGQEAASEHSMRRAGAQCYARRGVPIAIIQFLGRWGGATVMRYVDEALHDQAAHAMSSGEWRPASSSSAASACLAVVVAAADVEKRQEHWEHAVEQAVATAMREWEVKWQQQQRVTLGGVRRHGNAQKVHDVLIGDVLFPPSTWVTRCGWRFGGSAHERTRGDEVTCEKCKGVTAGGETSR